MYSPEVIKTQELAYFLDLTKGSNSQRFQLLKDRGIIHEKCELCKTSESLKEWNLEYTYCKPCLLKVSEESWKEQIKLYKEMLNHIPEGKFFCCRCKTYCDKNEEVATCDMCNKEECLKCKKDMRFSCCFK